ncbi:P-loop containing nucleoside triphosphate hydrolase protein [Gloeophyllum trabeum ATCC 11539]|uniref:Kinesin-like protein n=1 Tax=Gloeophyllum trabeum (strain ATCC 11539 / FP-39264 / Madison 617) TaxID=670483 RepID=S7Q5K3_GLOTA|nr:P-loop containing nucleoside triphosphate hydrolase protein [Gloeophyllum trabeum ATCC 11539]EPQ55331.1 P-loop containing nucleoside triphosphate hydrolase protein [Gloeophyllum trabeum ATCC 11539]
MAAASATSITSNLSLFRSLLSEWSAKQPKVKGLATTPEEISASFDRRLQDKASGIHDTGKDVVVAFRTRPPLENEAAEKFKGNQEEGDLNVPAEVTFCEGITLASAEPGVFIAHVPSVKWNGPTLQHKAFDADLAFGPHIDNEEVYKRTVVANDLIPLALSGGISCILAYGQTGSGKTFTMEGLEHRIARDLFRVAEVMGKRFAEAEGAEDQDIFEFGVTFLELLGKHASDLVEQPEGVDAKGEPIRKEVPIQEDKAGDVRPRLISTTVKSSAELEDLINRSLAHRRTSATARNATSSRSHAVLTIRVKNKLLPYAEEGQLILVDLAGSERYEDSKAHDKQRMDESRENNKSLMNLKECVRAKAKMAAEEGFVHIPWRMNKLTMLLKPIFDIESRQQSKAIIIAHVSPHIQDSVHSVNTLSYASPFKTAPPKPRGPAPYDPQDPRTWNHEQTVSWLKEEFIKRAKQRKQSEWNMQAKKAAKEGKKLKPLDPNLPVNTIIDVDKLCPGEMTAMNYAKMYVAEFVERCLQAARKEGDPPLSQSYATVVKGISAEVAGQLYYLVLTAKTRKRTAIMKSRKTLEVKDTYDEEIQMAQLAYREKWNHAMWDATKKAQEQGGDVAEAVAKMADVLMEEWKANGGRVVEKFSDEEIQEAKAEIGAKKWDETIETELQRAENYHVQDTEWARNTAIKRMVDAFRERKKTIQQGSSTRDSPA